MIYEVEQYEIHTVTYRVKANSEAEAIQKVLEGDGDMVDDSQEYIETANEKFLPLDPEIIKELEELGVQIEETAFDDSKGVPSIRSVEETDDDEI
jgi:hypothetical protein